MPASAAPGGNHIPATHPVDGDRSGPRERSGTLVRPCPPSPPPPQARSRCGCSTTPSSTGPSSTGSRSPTVAPSPTSAGYSPTVNASRCAACATAAQPTPSASRSTPPPATATKTPSCSPDSPPAPRNRPSTPPAPSTSPGPATSQARDPELTPRRTYGVTHLAYGAGVSSWISLVDDLRNGSCAQRGPVDARGFAH